MATCGAKRHLRPQVLAPATSEASEREEVQHLPPAAIIISPPTANNHQVYSLNLQSSSKQLQSTHTRQRSEMRTDGRQLLGN
jgi:hypothetical protein